MKLTLDRRWKKDTYTIGILYVDGVRFSETLEDKDRGLDQGMSEANIKHYKVYGETAIPTGTYKVSMCDISPKFKNRSWAKKYGGIVPRLIGVKGFSGVLIHPLNYAKDSLGCIGVGENKVKGGIINSQKWWFSLMDEYLIPARQRGETIYLTIK